MTLLWSIRNNHIVLNCRCGHVGIIAVQELIDVMKATHKQMRRRILFAGPAGRLHILATHRHIKINAEQLTAAVQLLLHYCRGNPSRLLARPTLR
jgi:hypothetical protein